jgi:hypothetical protein
MDNTKSYTDANGTTYIIDKKTRKIQSSMCRSGFIYDAEGKRNGHIDDVKKLSL